MARTSHDTASKEPTTLSSASSKSHDRTNVNWGHSLEAQIEKLYNASIVVNLDTTQITAQLDATRPSHKQFKIKL
jgi:hypothetical protein